MSDPGKAILVVSAHAADFVWRAGGTIALYAARGYRVRILCLSFGERGESQGAWAEPGMTIERVKDIRRAESSRAAEILGAEIRFFDSGDYPLRPSDATLHEMVVELNAPSQPALRPDAFAARPLQLRSSGRARGHPAGARLRAGAGPSGRRALARRAAGLSCSSRISPSSAGSSRDVLLDVTTAWERKQQAMESMEAQGHLLDYYTDLGKRRGTQAVRNGGTEGHRVCRGFPARLSRR